MNESQRRQKLREEWTDKGFIPFESAKEMAEQKKFDNKLVSSEVFIGSEDELFRRVRTLEEALEDVTRAFNELVNRLGNGSRRVEEFNKQEE